MTTFNYQPINFTTCSLYLILGLVLGQQDKFKALINFNSKINVMTPIYTAQLALNLKLTNISAQKINGLALKIYKITIAEFLI